MVIDQNKKLEIEKFIDENEQSKWILWVADEAADLLWLEKETKEWLISKWLKNNDDLLTYAELTMKTENLNIWESIKHRLLELKLLITCPYFADFKNFLKELKLWNNISADNDSVSETSADSSAYGENASESNETLRHTFCWTNVSSIKSEPFEKSSQSWVTWNSKTAYNNWKNFWLILPTWDAYDAWKMPWKDSIQSIPKDKINKKPQKSWEWINASMFWNINKWNFADIYTDSISNYGGRAIAFKDDNWQWYVLDPYTRVNWRLDGSPKKLEDYIKVMKIVKAHIYESTWYLPESQNTATNPQVEKAVQWAIWIAEDNCHWYEWWWNGKNWQYDCSGLVNSAFRQAGFDIKTNWTASMRKEYTNLWFERISPYDSSKLKRWDIVLKENGKRHTEIYTWNWKFVWARSNKDRKSWDSGGKEIAETSANWLTKFGRDWILRYKW